MPRTFVVCLLLSLVLGACDAPAGGGDANAVIARARALARDGARTDALGVLREALSGRAGAGGDDEVALRLEIADISLALGNPVSAEKELRLVGEHGGGSPRALLLRGECLRQLERFSEAEAALRKGLEREPSHLAGRLALARTLYRLGEATESATLFERVLRAADDVDALASLGMDADDRLHLRLEYARALLLDGRVQEGADELARLLIARPFESKLYSELARAQFRLGNRQAGRFLQELYRIVSQEDFQKNVEESLERAGMQVFGLSQRAYNLLREKRFLEAIRVYERARALETRDSRVFTHSATTLAAFFRHTDALRIIDEALKKRLGPVSGLLERRGESLVELGRRADAESAFNACMNALADEGDIGGIEKGQADQAVIFSRVENLLELGSAREALALAERAAATSRDAWRAHELLGRTRLALADARGALQALSKATSDGGTIATVAVTHARALMSLGELQGAANELARAVKADATNAEVYEAFELLASKGLRLEPAFFDSKRSLDAIDARIDALEKRVNAMSLDRECGLLYIDIGAAHIERRSPNRALDVLLFGIELAPDDPRGYRLALSLLRRNEDAFLRLRLLDRLAGLEPDDPDVHLAMANIYVKLGVLRERAVTAAHAHAKLRPGPEAERLLGELGVETE